MSIRDTRRDAVEQIVEGAIQLGQDDAIRLAHRVLERFPSMRKKHMFIAGGAALSSAILIGAAVAIARRVRDGQTPHEAAEDVTEEELENLHLLDRHRRRPARAETEAMSPAAGAAMTTEAQEDAARAGGA